MKRGVLLLIALLFMSCDQKVDVKQRVAVVGKTDTTNTTIAYNGDMEIPGDVIVVRILLCKTHGVWQFADESNKKCSAITNSFSLRDCIIRRYPPSQYTIVKYVKSVEETERDVLNIIFYAYLKEKEN